MTPETAQAFLDANFAPWVLALHPEVTRIDRDLTVLSMAMTDNLNRTGGILSGQALTALADTAMVLACCGHLGELIPVATVTLDTQFLRPATGTKIRAEAEITRAGRSMFFARCTLLAEPAQKPVALATATFAR